MSLKNYLQLLKANVNGSLKSVKFVTGNQSADMDSCISAIAYSYYNHLSTNQFVVPLINVPRSDFKLRRDIIKLLLFHSINLDLLYFLEDFSTLTKSVPKVDLILVDHCNIQGDLLNEYLEQDRLNVVSIIDHHADENVFLTADPRIIKPCGSCSSLVFNYWNSVLHEKAQDPEILLILLGPLLIDTSNFTQKIEQDDTIAYNVYKSVLENSTQSLFANTNEPNNSSGSSIATVNPTNGFFDFYKQLKTAKKDMSGFSLLDVLHKDYKQFKFTDASVGFSSIGKSLAWVVKNYHNELKLTLHDILKANNIDIIIITSSYTKKVTDEYTREFAYYYEDTENEKFNTLYDLLKDKLQFNDDIYKLDKIEKKNIKTKGVFKIYNQEVLSASRKQIVPIVKDVLESN